MKGLERSMMGINITQTKIHVLQAFCPRSNYSFLSFHLRVMFACCWCCYSRQQLIASFDIQYHYNLVTLEKTREQSNNYQIISNLHLALPSAV